MVQRKVYIDTPDMWLLPLRDNQLWHPPTDEHDIFSILTQEVRQFDQHRFSCPNGIC